MTIEKGMGSFIVCEGLDCAGKTTSITQALKLFEDDLDSDHVLVYSKGLKTNTPFGRISRLYPSTLSLLTELLYLDMIHIRPRLDEGTNIIQDRWYYSVLSHTQESRKGSIIRNLSIQYLSGPDMLVYFTVSSYERLRRLENRINSTLDDKALIKNPDLISEREARYFRHYNDFEGPRLIIDTTYLQEEESGLILYQSIRSYLEGGISLSLLSTGIPAPCTR